MIPTDFPEANRTLTWSGPPLRVYTDGERCISLWRLSWRERIAERCISLWRLSWRERIAALLGGLVRLSVLSGGTQPPVGLDCCWAYSERRRPYLFRWPRYWQLDIPTWPRGWLCVGWSWRKDRSERGPCFYWSPDATPGAAGWWGISPTT